MKKIDYAVAAVVCFGVFILGYNCRHQYLQSHLKNVPTVVRVNTLHHDTSDSAQVVDEDDQ